MPTAPSTSTASAFIPTISQRQRELALSDDSLGQALEMSESLIRLIKAGEIRFPPKKIPVLARFLDLPSELLLRLLLTESAPEILSLIDDVFNPLSLTKTEQNLIKHLRKLSRGRETTPIVFDGQTVFALVTA